MWDEIDFYIRVTEAINRCGEVITMGEQMKMFMKGLNPSDGSLVSQYRKDHPSVHFLRLFKYVITPCDLACIKVHGSAIRAREKKLNMVPLQEPSKFSRSGSLHPSWRPRGSAKLIN